jgi:hypothetical protein
VASVVVLRNIRRARGSTRFALRAQGQASIDLGLATGRLTAAQAAAAADRQKIATANKHFEASLVNMARAANRLAVEQNHGATRAVIAAAATQIFAKNTSALAVAQEKLAGKFAMTNPALSRAHTRSAALALAAIDLAQKIHDIPSTTQIDVHFRQDIHKYIEQARILTGQLFAIPNITRTVNIKFLQAHGTPGAYGHAMGGMAYAGQVSLVGEQGPELRVEGSNARYIPAGETRRMLSGGGGGGEQHYHFHFPHAMVVDAKTIKQAAQLIRPELQRLQASTG